MCWPVIDNHPAAPPCLPALQVEDAKLLASDKALLYGLINRIKV